VDKIDVNIYDGLIGADLHKRVYDWTQSVSYYGGFGGSPPKFDYKPGAEDHVYPALVRRALFRHPIAADQADVDGRGDLDAVMELWDEINTKVFQGRANWHEGLLEGHPGLSGASYSYGDPAGSYADKYGYSKDKVKSGWRIYLNARAATVGVSPTINMYGVDGAVHRDVDFEHQGDPGYYTVLFVANLEWLPSWRSDILYYGNEAVGEKHWKGDYEIGFPEIISANKPGRIVVAGAHVTHSTLSPAKASAEMSLRMAFRVKVTPRADGTYV